MLSPDLFFKLSGILPERSLFCRNLQFETKDNLISEWHGSSKKLMSMVKNLNSSATFGTIWIFLIIKLLTTPSDFQVHQEMKGLIHWIDYYPSAFTLIKKKLIACYYNYDTTNLERRKVGSGRFKSLQCNQVLEIAHVRNCTGEIVPTKLTMIREMQKLIIHQYPKVIALFKLVRLAYMFWRAVMLAIKLGKNPERPAFVRFLPSNRNIIVRH